MAYVESNEIGISVGEEVVPPPPPKPPELSTAEKAVGAALIAAPFIGLGGALAKKRKR